MQQAATVAGAEDIVGKEDFPYNRMHVVGKALQASLTPATFSSILESFPLSKFEV